MDRDTQLVLFQAQVKNVRELDKAWTHIKRSINTALTKDNQASAVIHTKLLALVYSAWLEATFSKLIHTPYGFELNEISQIKDACISRRGYRGNIVNAWKKCVDIAVSRIDSGKSNYKPNIRQKLNRLIKEYVEDPSLLRNKIAHGQWSQALNSDNTGINNQLTESIATIDVVKLDVLRDACKGLCEIVEALIESPERSFHRDYWIILSELEEHLSKTANYSLADKITKLKSKSRSISCTRL